jgi:anti-sigma28 factor (negative regulator of flagellin synthesis)
MPNTQSVHGATRRTLSKIKGFSEIKVEKIKEAIQKCQVQMNPLPSDTELS